MKSLHTSDFGMQGQQSFPKTVSCHLNYRSLPKYSAFNKHRVKHIHKKKIFVVIQGTAFLHFITTVVVELL